MALLNLHNRKVEVACLAVVLGLFVTFSVVMIVTDPKEVVAAAADSEGLAELNPGDTAWIIVSCALVLLMTPGVAFFYGGGVRHKNVIATIMQCLVTLGLITVLWTMYGFSLAFGDDAGYPGFIGNPATYGLYRNVGALPNPAFAATIPFSIYSVFQLMFAIITPSLIVGSFAERVNFSALCLFIFLWHTIVYCPLAHMVWHPAGLIRTFGVLDFAGGTVVHMSSGYAALIGALFLGPSLKDSSGAPREPANVPYVILGTALLWFGWFGFNAGSAGAANFLAAQAFLTTNTAAGAAMLTWLLMDNLRGHKSRASGVCAGAIAGLVGITPAAGFVTVGGAMLIGIIVGVVSSMGQHFMEKFRHRVDDTLDVWAIHGLGGTTGMICTSLFATTAANPAGFDGLFFGGVTLFWKTLVVLIIVVPWICLFSFICYFVTNLILPMRASEQDELMGLDVSKHGERATGYDASFISGSIHNPSAHAGTQAVIDIAEQGRAGVVTK
eukprot:jgi/Chrzof1/3907/Cz13g12260.t1